MRYQATFVPWRNPPFGRLEPGEWTWLTEGLTKPSAFPRVVGLMGTAPDGSGFMVLVATPGVDIDQAQVGTVSGYGDTITATSGDPSAWRIERGEWVRA